MIKIIDRIFKPKYPLDSAGRSMITNVPIALPNEKILDIREKLFKEAKNFETLNYVYVIDQQGKLIGVFSLKDVFQKPEETEIKKLISQKIIKAGPYTDQEKVAFLALKHNLKAIPIVSKENVFLGVIPSDVILKILHSENIEDALRFAGIRKNGNFIYKSIEASPFVLTKIRLPWLIFGLLGGLFAAQIVNFFEGSLKSHFILASFIPLIVYMADAVGVQAQTLFIRGLAVESNLDIKKYFLKEIKISFFIALILGLLLGLISSLLFGTLKIAIILASSLFLTVICASSIAVLIPWFLINMKKDPAIGSGPFATIVRDVLSLIIYFLIASLLLIIF